MSATVLRSLVTSSESGTAGRQSPRPDPRDDSVGGDANHDDDATAPGAGWWLGLWIQGAGTASLECCQITYAGYCHWRGLYKTGSGAMDFVRSTIANTAGHGMNVTNSAGPVLLDESTFRANSSSGLYLASGAVTASGCLFSHNGDYGVYHETNDSIVYADNTFTGNAKGCVAVGGGTMAADSAWTRGAGDPFTLTVTSDITVAATATLAVFPGVTVRFSQFRGLWVEGALEANGSPEAEIALGGTGEGPGWWWGLTVQNAGSATLDHCRLTGAGYYDSVGIRKTGAGTLSLTNSRVSAITGDGLRLAAGSASSASAGNLFANCNYGVRLGIGASFDDATSDFQDNNVNVCVDGGAIGGETFWRLKPDYSFYLSGDTTVASGATLMLGPGTVAKPARFVGLHVDGTVDAQGSLGAPIAFTDWRDDSLGGDANMDDDASAPAPAGGARSMSAMAVR